MDRNLIKAKLSRGEQAGMAADDYAFAIDYDGLAPAEFFD